MKCKTCKYWGNKNGIIGSCGNINELPSDESISIYLDDYISFGLDNETREKVMGIAFLKNAIMVGKNFGCENWMPLVNVCVETTDGDIRLFGDNRND